MALWMRKEQRDYQAIQALSEIVHAVYEWEERGEKGRNYVEGNTERENGSGNGQQCAGSSQWLFCI